MSTAISNLRQQKPGPSASRKHKTKSEPEREPSLGAHGEAAVNDLDLGQEERQLRAFDLSSKFGPCVGLTRLERWERAKNFGLEPPEEVRAIIMQHGLDSSANGSIWHNRV